MSGLLMGKTYNTTLSTNMKAVLGAYADHANDDGTSIYPGEPYMVVKTSLSVSSVRRITAILKKTGLLQQTKRGHTGQRAEFEIDVAVLERIQIERPPRGSPPDTHYEMRDRAPKWVLDTNDWVSDNGERVLETTGVGITSSTPNATEPSEPSENHQLAPSAPADLGFVFREGDSWGLTRGEYRTAMKDALVAAMDWHPKELTKRQWDKVEVAAKELCDIGADPDDVWFRAQVYRVNFAGATMTPIAIATNWADLKTPREPIPARQVKRAAARAQSRAAIAALEESE